MDFYNKGVHWADDEIRTFLAIWSEPSVRRELENFRNKQIFDTISAQMANYGYYRDANQCRIKMQNMKREFRIVQQNPDPNSAVTMRVLKHLPELMTLMYTSTQAIGMQVKSEIPDTVKDDVAIVAHPIPNPIGPIIITSARSIANEEMNDETIAGEVDAEPKEQSDSLCSLPVTRVPIPVSNSSSVRSASPTSCNVEQQEPQITILPETQKESQFPPANSDSNSLLGTFTDAVNRLTTVIERYNKTQVEMQQKEIAVKRYERRRENRLRRKHEKAMRSEDREHQLKVIRLLLAGIGTLPPATGTI